MTVLDEPVAGVDAGIAKRINSAAFSGQQRGPAPAARYAAPDRP